MHSDLLKELKIKEEQIKSRDLEIQIIISEKQAIKAEREEMINQIEDMKTQQLIDRKVLMMAEAERSGPSEGELKVIEEKSQLKKENDNLSE